jgi:N utilization substance protein B
MQNEVKIKTMTTENNKDKSTSSTTERHNARSYAVQAMYQWQIAGAPISEIEQQFLTEHIDKKLDMDFFKELIRGIPANKEEIDLAIKPFMNRSMSDIDPVELAVLRLATYELLKRPDIPYRVIINEALNLTKEFGSVEGYKFINGILDRIAKSSREVEVKMKKE